MAIDFDAIKDRFPLLDIAIRYVPSLVQRGNEYKGLCPFHDDTNPSFTIYRGSDGHERYRCFACGAGSNGGDVIEFMCAIENCTTAEAVKRLTNGDIPQIGLQTTRQLPKDQTKAWRSIVPPPADAPKYDPENTFNPKRGEFVKYYPKRMDTYRDENGTILFYVVRLQFADGEKLCITVSYCVGPGGEHHWCAIRPDPPHTLLGLEELKKHPAWVVVLVSGEKCKGELTDEIPKGMVAVSWLGGDNNVKNTDWSPLKDRKIYVWADHDETGHSSIEEIKRLVG